jgi:hypothetical protein
VTQSSVELVSINRVHPSAVCHAASIGAIANSIEENEKSGPDPKPVRYR